MLTCGLLGRTLGHSYSTQIHQLLGNYLYKLFEVEPEDLSAFLRGRSYDRLNVTIPYKKAVIPYCSGLSETAKAIGSVNTIVRLPDGKLFGDNTDAYGFEWMLRSSGIDVSGKKALVFGSGGASLTVCYVLQKLGADVTVISRQGENNYENLSRHADAQILVNTTPLGMYPGNGESPCDLRQFPQCEGVLDLIYNPARTALLLQADALGIPCEGGLSMLVAQAKLAAERFTDSDIADSVIDRIVGQLSAQMQNIVLIGMPGCGKSTVGAELAGMLGIPFHDADAELEKRVGMSVPEFFASFGEDAFREEESFVLAELGKRSGCVIATGGGCVLRPENYALLHQNSRILWIRRELSDLPINGRPISQATPREELFRQREPLYRKFADDTVVNDRSVDACVQRILEELL